jgi:hypothetical protein
MGGGRAGVGEGASSIHLRARSEEVDCKKESITLVRRVDSGVSSSPPHSALCYTLDSHLHPRSAGA